jgi:hypothetical protein
VWTSFHRSLQIASNLVTGNRKVSGLMQLQLLVWSFFQLNLQTLGTAGLNLEFSIIYSNLAEILWSSVSFLPSSVPACWALSSPAKLSRACQDWPPISPLAWPQDIFSKVCSVCFFDYKVCSFRFLIRKVWSVGFLRLQKRVVSAFLIRKVCSVQFLRLQKYVVRFLIFCSVLDFVLVHGDDFGQTAIHHWVLVPSDNYSQD